MSFWLPSRMDLFFRGSHTTNFVTCGFNRSYNQAAEVPSLKVTCKSPRSPSINRRHAGFCFYDGFHPTPKGATLRRVTGKVRSSTNRRRRTSGIAAPAVLLGSHLVHPLLARRFYVGDVNHFDALFRFGDKKGERDSFAVFFHINDS